MERAICSVMQPTFLPWIGYFDLIDSADQFVFYDDVQFVKQSWHTRNRIITPNGITYIAVPVKKTPLNTNINQVELDNSKPWSKKLLKTFFYTYQKSEYFNDIYPFLETQLKKEYKYFYELNIALIEKISDKMGIVTKFHRSSNLSPTDKTKDARLVEVCKELNMDAYLSTLGSASYIEQNNEGGEFPKNNINLYYHNYNHPNYAQLNKEFEPYMSIVDLLFNKGFESSLEIIRSGRNQFLTSKDL